MQEFWSRVFDVLETKLFTVGGQEVTTSGLIALGVILAVGWIVSRLLRGITSRVAKRRSVIDAGTVDTMNRLTHYGIMLVATGVGLETLGFDLTTLFAAGAVLGVAIAFAMQNIAQNFVSGVILLVERSITAGDILFVEGQMVRVASLGMRATIVRSLDDEELIIPNSVLVQSTVKNFTLTDALYRIRVEVGVVYSSDVEQVREVLLEGAQSVEGRALRKDPVVLLSEFGDSAIVFDVSIWVEDPWLARSIRSDLHFALRRALLERGITIAFPQLDVHFDPGVSVAPSAPPRGPESPTESESGPVEE